MGSALSYYSEFFANDLAGGSHPHVLGLPDHHIWYQKAIFPQVRVVEILGGFPPLYSIGHRSLSVLKLK